MKASGARRREDERPQGRDTADRPGLGSRQPSPQGHARMMLGRGLLPFWGS